MTDPKAGAVRARLQVRYAGCRVLQGRYADARQWAERGLAEAEAAVPDELVDEVALCGPKERIRDLLGMWQDSPVTTLIVGSGQPEALEVMAELIA